MCERESSGVFLLFLLLLFGVDIVVCIGVTHL